MSAEGFSDAEFSFSDASEPERVTELEGLLASDFDTFREVSIEYHWGNGRKGKGRVDLLAIPRADELDGVILAFEVKGHRFDLERALKQSADYVNGRVLNGPHEGKRIAACFLYPEMKFDHAFAEDAPFYRTDGDGDPKPGVWNLIAQWRVGRGFVDHNELTLAIGYEVIWRNRRGWTTKAPRMLLGKRTVGGSRREIIEHNGTGVSLADIGLANPKPQGDWIDL